MVSDETNYISTLIGQFKFEITHSKNPGDPLQEPLLTSTSEENLRRLWGFLLPSRETAVAVVTTVAKVGLLQAFATHMLDSVAEDKPLPFEMTGLEKC